MCGWGRDQFTTQEIVTVGSVRDLGSSKYAQEADALRQIRKRAKRLKRPTRKSPEVVLQEEVDRLRAENNHMRFHLQWIYNPAGNDICTPVEIAKMGLSKYRKQR